MKIKTPPQVTQQTMFTHVQAITDDLRNVLKGGLSFNDAQLPFQTISTPVTSGTPVSLNIQNPYSIVGCFPIQTNGAEILSFKTNLSNGILTATLTMSSTNATIIFLVVGV